MSIKNVQYMPSHTRYVQIWLISHLPSKRKSAEQILAILKNVEIKPGLNYDLFSLTPVTVGDGVPSKEIISALSGRDIYSLWKLSASDLYR